MPEPIFNVLLAVFYLTVKHTVADYFLQTPYQFLNKGRYGHPGGLLHASIHSALTAPVFLILPAASASVVAIILAIEFFIHYHIDWIKEWIVNRYDWQVDSAGFWNALGTDQLAHHLTYLGIIVYLSGGFDGLSLAFYAK